MNDFYVYCHKRKDNGVTFYIGNGSIRVRYYENGIRKTKHFPTKNKDVESVLFDAINFLNSRSGYEQHNK